MNRQLSRAAGALSAALAVTLALAGSASALSFRMEAQGPDLERGGTGSFTVLIDGLLDNTANQAATALTLESYTFGDGTPGDLSLLAQGQDLLNWTSAGQNDFSVQNGEIILAEFSASNFVGGGTSGATDDSVNTLFIGEEIVRTGILSSSWTLLVNQLGPETFDVNVRSGGDQGTSISFTEISAVPIPAAAPLLIAGLGVLFGLGRQRRKMS